MTKYVVQINMKDGSKKFVRLGRRGAELVNQKIQASKFDKSDEASWVSNKFWNDHWIDEEYDTREESTIKSRGPYEN